MTSPRAGSAIQRNAYIFVCFLMMAVVTSTMAQAADSGTLIRVSADDFYEISDIEAINTIDYGEFVWLELVAESLEAVESRGVPFELQRSPEGMQIHGAPVNKQVTESVSAMTAIASQVAAAPGSAFYLVQFLGPAKDEWVEQLSAEEAAPLQYFAPYAHLVYVDADTADRLAKLGFVRWVGRYLPEYRINPGLLEKSGVIQNVDVKMLVDGAANTIAEVESLGGALIEQDDVPAIRHFMTATFELPASALSSVSQLSRVLTLTYRPPLRILEDEMSSQIAAGNFGPIPAGYQNWLTNNGINGTGQTIALIDTGYDSGVDGSSHPDLSGRLVMVGIPTDAGSAVDGHGTHVGGIMAGNASLGSMDGSGFLLGQGMAPSAILVVRSFNGTDTENQRDAVTRGSVASNNSYRVQAAGSGYSAADSTLDGLVRDADSTTAALEPMSIVFSAGNSGATGPTKNGKNIIAVGNSLNERTVPAKGEPTPQPGTVDTTQNIDNLWGTSSRGPAADGRIYPHITAPGTNIVSTRSQQAGIDLCDVIATGASAPATDPTYSMCTGTSMAAPHVTGSIALVQQWWNTFKSGNASPAMVKALLVNGAVDMGAADIPNNNEGWGRINLSNVINTGISTVYVDQTIVLEATGNSWSGHFERANPAKPVKVTVEWTDAPAAGGAITALVNNLDLTVMDGTNTYLGNVFAGGVSAIGGAADTLNNLENVFIATPPTGFTITVSAAAINGDGVPGNGDTTDQDFALVCSNCVSNCDIDNDGFVGPTDLSLITAVRNTPALPGDPRDNDANGVINLNDARQCVLLCTLPGCEAVVQQAEQPGPGC